MRLTHGCSKRGGKETPEYRAWGHMHSRCYNPKTPDYKNYGARGIQVIFSSFEAFLLEVKCRPSALHSIDRIDNDRHYEPGNVKWSTKKEQNRNKRGLHLMRIQGQLMCIAEASEVYGIKQSTISMRLQRGLSDHAAVSLPE